MKESPSWEDALEAARGLDEIRDLDAPASQELVERVGSDFRFSENYPPLVDAILRLFERYPDRHEANGMRYLNRVLVELSEGRRAVVESFLRGPLVETTFVFGWWCGDGDVMVEDWDLRRLLRDLADDSSAPDDVRSTAQEWLEPDSDIHPGLQDPNLPVPTYEEIRAWEDAEASQRQADIKNA